MCSSSLVSVLERGLDLVVGGRVRAEKRHAVAGHHDDAVEVGGDHVGERPHLHLCVEDREHPVALRVHGDVKLVLDVSPTPKTTP
jgi:hypothetical protein